MSAPLWVNELAAAFWKDAGTIEPFPRSLHSAVAYALPLDVIYRPRLHAAGVQQWLRRNQITWACPTPDRWLRACLAARSGHGFIFIDGTDPEDEQRFSLAHELAHFLRDYWQPRRRACQRLGQTVLEVFDGLRPPTVEERVDALVARVPIGFHVHLLERPGQSNRAQRAIAQAEWEADLLAYELLAPAAEVLRTMSATDPRYRDQIAQRLQRAFGLPQVQVEDYARELVPNHRTTGRLLNSLGFRC